MPIFWVKKSWLWLSEPSFFFPTPTSYVGTLEDWLGKSTLPMSRMQELSWYYASWKAPAVECQSVLPGGEPAHGPA